MLFLHDKDSPKFSIPNIPATSHTYQSATTTMNLVTSNFDIQTEILEIADIDWHCVVALGVRTVWPHHAPPVVWFWPVVEWQDKTWSRLSLTYDITHARQVVTALSIRNDKPVNDCTRPVASGLLRENTARLLQTTDADVTVATDPHYWGGVTGIADELFHQGATDPEFLMELDVFLDGLCCEAVSKGRSEHAVNLSRSAVLDDSLRRWTVLRAANS